MKFRLCPVQNKIEIRIQAILTHMITLGVQVWTLSGTMAVDVMLPLFYFIFTKWCLVKE